MLCTQVPNWFGSARTIEPTRCDPPMTEPFMFTLLFFVTCVLLGGLALATILSS